MTILTDNFAKFFCLNCHTNTHVSNLMHFQGELFKNEALRSENVKYPTICNYNLFISYFNTT